MTAMAAISRTVDGVRTYAGSFTWTPVVNFSRAAVLALLQRVEVGVLLIVDTDGSLKVCGGPKAKDGEPKVQLTLHDDAFWVRMLLFADMGFAESYMLGDVSCSNLVDFFQLFILNREKLSNATTLTSSVAATISSLARSTNTLSNALLNVSAHYDISNAMFSAFLSDDMTYSCPVWLPKSDPGSSEETLEQAQQRKLERFITNARIKATDHVLEIGTGWGSFAIAAVRKTGCSVTTVTLSKEQKDLAEKRIAAAGLEDDITVLLCDYRAIPTPMGGYFDKVVSIEMLEAVGREFLDTYFGCIDRYLRPDGGIAVFQCITMPETRYESYYKGEDFIRKYIFPGGHLPSVSQLVASINKGSNGSLIVDSIENIGGHYAKTLRLWNEKFQRNFDSRIAPALMNEHAGMTESDVDVFRRKWEYYFTYCESGFNTKTLGDVIITVGREGAMEMIEEVPL